LLAAVKFHLFANVLAHYDPSFRGTKHEGDKQEGFFPPCPYPSPFSTFSPIPHLFFSNLNNIAYIIVLPDADEEENDKDEELSEKKKSKGPRQHKYLLFSPPSLTYFLHT
jgi:hypothetical protein